jgi:hypothetical protein
MKSLAKILLVGAIAVMAIALTAVPSEAAKKKKAAKMMGCGDGGMCSTQCEGSGCMVNICGADKQWHTAILTPFCLKGQCPPPCG